MPFVARLGAAGFRLLPLLLAIRRGRLRGGARRLLRTLQTQHQLDQLCLAQTLKLATTHPALQSVKTARRKGVGNYPERACRRSLGHEEGLAIASLPLRESAAEASAWSQANEDSEVGRHHRGGDIGLEVVEPAPGAAGQAVGPLEAGDAGLDPGPEVAQLAIDPAAADHVFDAEAALLVKGHVAHPARLRAIQ